MPLLRSVALPANQASAVASPPNGVPPDGGMVTPSGHRIVLPPEQIAALQAYLQSQQGGATSPELAQRIAQGVAAQPQGNPYMRMMPQAMAAQQRDSSAAYVRDLIGRATGAAPGDLVPTPTGSDPTDNAPGQTFRRIAMARDQAQQSTPIEQEHPQRAVSRDYVATLMKGGAKPSDGE